MGRIVSNINKIKVSGRSINKKPRPAGAIKIDRPNKPVIIKRKKGLDNNYNLDFIELE